MLSEENFCKKRKKAGLEKILRFGHEQFQMNAKSVGQTEPGENTAGGLSSELNTVFPPNHHLINSCAVLV